jgi:hypothetical protein
MRCHPPDARPQVSLSCAHPIERANHLQTQQLEMLWGAVGMIADKLSLKPAGFVQIGATFKTP